MTGKYVYRLSIDLSCHNPGTISIAGAVVADDDVQVYVNGNPVTNVFGSPSAASNFSIPNGSYPSAASYFVKGLNDIDFVVTNQGSTSNPTGLRVQFSSASADADTSASGAKIQLSSASGSMTGGMAATITSDIPVNWQLPGGASGTLTSNSNVLSTYTAPSSLSTFLVMPVKGTSQADSQQMAYKTLYFNAGSSSATDAASFISSTSTLPPSTMVSAASASVVLRFQNTGTSTWSPGSYVVASENAVNWGNSWAALSASVAPGAVAEFTIPITAPTSSTNQSFEFQWRMRQGASNFFGSAAQSTVVVGPFTPVTENLNFFNTGAKSVNSTGTETVLTSGYGMDAHWYTENVTDDSSFAAPPYPLLMLNNGSGDGANSHRYTSYGVGGQESRPSVANGFFTQWIYLEGHDLNSINLYGWARMDDSGRITINDQIIYGVASSSDSSGFFGFAWSQYKEFAISSSTGGNAAGKFTPGWNKITFEVDNAGCCTLGLGVMLGYAHVTRNTMAGPKNVKIAPVSRSTLTTGQRVALSAALANALKHEQGMTWSASPSNLGTLQSDGNIGIFEANSSSGVVTLTATSSVNTNWTASVQIQINPANGAEFLGSESTLPPATLSSGEPSAITLKFRNSGSTTWSAGSFYVASNNAETWGQSAQALAANVAPNGVAQFTFTITAPTVNTNENRAFLWRMREGSSNFFGESASRNVTVQASPVEVSVSPSSAVTLLAGQTANFIATVSGAGNSTLNWTNPAHGSFQHSSTQSGATNVYTAPSNISNNADVNGQVCSAAVPAICKTIPIQLRRLDLSLDGASGSLGYGQTRVYTVSMSGLLPGGSRVVNLQVASTNSSYVGTLSVGSVTIPGTGSSGSASFLYTAPVCGQVCASPEPVITITASSAQDATRVAQAQFSLTYPTQSLSTSGTLSGREAVFQIRVEDSTTQDQITWAEFFLSTSQTENHAPAGEYCRFRVYRAGGQFYSSLDNSSGGHIYVNGAITPTGGILEHPGNPNPNACRVLLGESSVTVEQNRIWNIILKVSNLKMTGTRYLRGFTYAGPNSVGSPTSYLGVAWTLASIPTFTITNSQGVTPPNIPEGFSLDLNVSAANVCSGCKVKMRLIQQQQDGALTNVQNPSGGYAAQATYLASGNRGSTRDIYVQLVVFKTLTAWLNDDYSPGNLDWSEENYYRIIVTSSYDLENLPSFPTVNPYTGSGDNPQPLNTTVSADGTSTTLIQFAVKNGPYTAIGNPGTVNSIDEYNFHINRSFSESGLAQDRANGCRLRIEIANGNLSPTLPGLTVWLDDDSGTSFSQSMTGTLPNNSSSGSINNSQCKVEFGSGMGTYGQLKGSDSTVLGFGLRFTFKVPFAGERYVFMKADRVNNGWTGWAASGSLTMQ